MKQYIVDAFAEKMFEGGPAGVCIMDSWLPDAAMQDIAMENNIAETAFAVKNGADYDLRWFTPNSEINLCGHATLAAGFILLNNQEKREDKIIFHTKGGMLSVARKGDLYEISLPAFTRKSYPVTEAIQEAFGGIHPKEVFLTEDIVCVLENAEEVRQAKPNFDKIAALPDGVGCHLTAPGDGGFDCVSRAFFPKLAIPEDQVCGRMHGSVIPYWADVTGKDELKSFQASPRTATILAKRYGSRVKLAGHAILFSEAEIFI